MSRLNCWTYPGLGFKYGDNVGEPAAATNAEVFPFRPGGGKIPVGPNGPWFACTHEKAPKVLPALFGSEHCVEFNVLYGVRPLSSVAVNGVVAKLTTSLSGFRPKET